MNVYRDRKAPTMYGKGTNIELDSNELAHAIRAYLYALGVLICGPSTVTVTTHDGESGLCGGAKIYVDPSGRVLHDGGEVT